MELTRNIVVVGASAGGVDALSTLLGALSADLPAAVFVVLHIPSHTASELHLVLDRVCALRVVSARDGQGIEAGTVYVAPADRHLMLEGDIVRLTRGPKECRVRPAIDVLFHQMAELARSAGAAQEADRLRARAEQTEQRLQPLRELVLDREFFGHGTKD